MIFERLMTRTPEAEAVDSLDAWWARHRAIAAEVASPIDLALAAGFAMDRLGYAFASGYQAAGVALFGPCDRPAALCATEGGSAHPRDMKTTLTALRLDGDKSFVTLGGFAEVYLVVASEGAGPDGKNRLRVVRLTQREGMRLVPLGEGPFVPEVPHAALELRGVVVQPDEVLPGDGYSRYLKPFRTVEDVHVHAALIGWLLQIARRHAPEAIAERLLASAATMRALAGEEASAPATHLALAGAMAELRRTIDDLAPTWASVDPVIAARWERDQRLLTVAGRVREARRQSAWAALRAARGGAAG
jgi:acyl-CoA dehydrogenase